MQRRNRLESSSNSNWVRKQAFIFQTLDFHTHTKKKIHLSNMSSREVIDLTGKHFVKQHVTRTQKEQKEVIVIEDDDKDAPIAAAKAPVRTDAFSGGGQMRERLQELAEAEKPSIAECAVCITKGTAQIAIFPCMHLCLCQDCSTQFSRSRSNTPSDVRKKCPKCRGPIKDLRRIYL